MRVLIIGLILLIFTPGWGYSSPILEHQVRSEAYRQEIDPELTHRWIHAESSYNLWAKSSKGAMGLCQMMPRTVTRWGIGGSLTKRRKRMAIAEVVIPMCIKAIKELLLRYNGDWHSALAAWHAGVDTGDFVFKIMYPKEEEK